LRQLFLQQVLSHHRTSKVLNSIGRIKTDVDLKPVVRRAAANKASDKIAKDSAALNRNLDQSFSTSTSDASSGKEDTFRNGIKHKKKGDSNLCFSPTSNSSDSCDSDLDKPIAKQKHQPTIMNSRKLASAKDSHKINSNTKKDNTNHFKSNFDKLLTNSKTAQVQFSRTTSDEEEKDFGKVNLPKIPHSEEDSISDDLEDRPVVSFLKRRSSNSGTVSSNKKSSQTPETNSAKLETKPKRLSEKLKLKNVPSKELEEKENLNRTSTISANALEENINSNNGGALSASLGQAANNGGDKLTFKNLSWPEQLARMKKARSAATRASVDSCNSADSVDSPVPIDLEKKETKTNNTLSLQPEKKMPMTSSLTTPSKYSKGPILKSKTTKIGNSESDATLTSTKKVATGVNKNNLALVYDFRDNEEPFTQSHAKKNNKNASKKGKDSIKPQHDNTTHQNQDVNALPPQLEPQVHITGNITNRNTTARYKKPKEASSKAGAKQPPQLLSNIYATNSINSGTNPPVANSPAKSKSSKNAKAINSTSKTSTHPVPTSESPGSSVKQMSIMAFVK
jgi:hypothetical protein